MSNEPEPQDEPEDSDDEVESGKRQPRERVRRIRTTSVDPFGNSGP